MPYSKVIHDRAWRVLESRKMRAQEDHLRVSEEIHRRIPRIVQIERAMAATATSLTQVILHSAVQAPEMIARLKEENQRLQRERRQLLEEYGYPPDILSKRYHCSECRDTGYAGNKVCSCFSAILQQEAAKELDLNANRANCRFDNFQLQYYSRQSEDDTGNVPFNRMSDILTFCREYASVFHLSSPSLLMIGHTGLGKTHLSLAIGRQVIKNGYGAVYTPAQRMFDRLESERFSRSSGREDEGDTLKLVMECDLLILDDLGTEFHTQFTTAALYNIINTRLMSELPTIISTNLELPAMESRYSQRVVSRLVCDYKVLRFLGEDIRFLRRMSSP